MGAVVVTLPPIVSVLPVATAIVPPKALMAIVFEMVAVVLANNMPVAAIVTAPDERWVPLLPPEATDKIPALMVVPPVKVLAPESITVPVLPEEPITKLLPTNTALIVKVEWDSAAMTAAAETPIDPDVPVMLAVPPINVNGL